MSDKTRTLKIEGLSAEHLDKIHVLSHATGMEDREFLQGLVDSYFHEAEQRIGNNDLRVMVDAMADRRKKTLQDVDALLNALDEPGSQEKPSFSGNESAIKNSIRTKLVNLFQFGKGNKRQKILGRDNPPENLSESTEKKYPGRLRAAEGKLVKSPISFSPDVKEALERAAAESDTTASVIIDQALRENPDIARHIETDTEPS